MKGGDVIILYALKSLQRAGVLKDRQIIVVMTGDEENPGIPVEVSRKDLIDAAKRSDIALAFEAAVGSDTGTIARRGIGSWVLTVKGKQAHSSGIFTAEDGYGAIYETARILDVFQKTLSSEKYLTLNPGSIVGGTDVTFNEEESRGTVLGKTNVIAQTAITAGDLRFLSEDQKEKAREKMRKIVSEGNLFQTSATIEFADGYPAMSPTDGNMRILKMLDQVSQDLGMGAVRPLDPGERGAGDISFVASYVDSLDGLGAIGKGSHSPEEEVNLDAIQPQIQRAALLIYRLSQEK
jgi:glutamate carboxypeptidase